MTTPVTFSLSDETTQALITAGIAAPSADNHHRVRFELSSDAIRLWALPQQVGSLLIHQQAFFEFSCGAVIENMVLTAAALGLSCEVTLEPAWREQHRVATLRFSPSTALATDPLVEAIFARHTNRHLYDRSAVGDDVLRVLSAAAIPYGEIHWCDTRQNRRTALKMIWLAESERFQRRALHAELFDSICFDDGWHYASQDGLAPGALGIEPFLRVPFKALRSWPLQSLLNRLGAAPILGLRAGALLAWSAPHIGLFSVPLESHSWIEAGRGFQRLWLEVTRANIVLQPMAAAIALSLQDPIPDWVRPPVRERLRDALQNLSGQRRPTMLFRIGRARGPHVTSGRLDAKHFILHGERQISFQERRPKP